MIPVFLLTFAGTLDIDITGGGGQTVETVGGSGTGTITTTGYDAPGDQRFVDSESNYFVDSESNYLKGAVP